MACEDHFFGEIIMGRRNRKDVRGCSLKAT